MYAGRRNHRAYAKEAADKIRVYTVSAGRKDVNPHLEKRPAMHQELDQKIRELTDLICNEKDSNEVARLAGMLDELLEERRAVLRASTPHQRSDTSFYGTP